MGVYADAMDQGARLHGLVRLVTFHVSRENAPQGELACSGDAKQYLPLPSFIGDFRVEDENKL